MQQINKQDFGNFISKKRKEKNMTQKDIADKLYISIQAVSKWERGQSLPDINSLIPLANLLDVSLVDLLGAKENIDADQSSDVENLLGKLVLIGKEEADIERKNKLKRAKLLLIFFIILGLEYYTLYKNFDINFENIIGILIVDLIFCIYFWIFLGERLPSYYDENKISFVSDGFFRINMVGISFNNKNWIPILKYLRTWSLSLMFLYPFIYIFLIKIGNDSSIFLLLSIIFITLFAPIYIIDRLYK